MNNPYTEFCKEKAKDIGEMTDRIIESEHNPFTQEHYKYIFEAVARRVYLTEVFREKEVAFIAFTGENFLGRTVLRNEKTLNNSPLNEVLCHPLDFRFSRIVPGRGIQDETINLLALTNFKYIINMTNPLCECILLSMDFEGEVNIKGRFLMSEIATRKEIEVFRISTKDSLTYTIPEVVEYEELNPPLKSLQRQETAQV